MIGVILIAGALVLLKIRVNRRRRIARQAALTIFYNKGQELICTDM